MMSLGENVNSNIENKRTGKLKLLTENVKFVLMRTYELILGFCCKNWDRGKAYKRMMTGMLIQAQISTTQINRMTLNSDPKILNGLKFKPPKK